MITSRACNQEKVILDIQEIGKKQSEARKASISSYIVIYTQPRGFIPGLEKQSRTMLMDLM